MKKYMSTMRVLGLLVGGFSGSMGLIILAIFGFGGQNFYVTSLGLTITFAVMGLGAIIALIVCLRAASIAKKQMTPEELAEIERIRRRRTFSYTLPPQDGETTRRSRRARFHSEDRFAEKPEFKPHPDFVSKAEQDFAGNDRFDYSKVEFGSASAKAAATETKDKPDLVCHKCGHINEPGDTACRACGEKL